METRRGRESFSGNPPSILLTLLPKTTPDPLAQRSASVGVRIGRVAAGGQVCDALAGGQVVGTSSRWRDRPAQPLCGGEKMGLAPSRICQNLGKSMVEGACPNFFTAAVGHRIPIQREPADLHADRPEDGCGPGRIPDAGGPGRHLLRRSTTRSMHQTVDQPGAVDRAAGRTASSGETQSQPSAGSRLSATAGRERIRTGAESRGILSHDQDE
jgi:hypothetical protein